MDFFFELQEKNNASPQNKESHSVVLFSVDNDVVEDDVERTIEDKNAFILNIINAEITGSKWEMGKTKV